LKTKSNHQIAYSINGYAGIKVFSHNENCDIVYGDGRTELVKMADVVPSYVTKRSTWYETAHTLHSIHV